MRTLVALGVVGVVVIAGCGGKAGDLVRPKDFTGASALGSAAPICKPGEAAQLAEPLVIDLDPSARVALEVAMQEKRVVVVSYDCVTLRVLPGCKGPEAEYTYAGVQRKEQIVQMKGSDELKANLPLSAGRLGSEIQSGRSIDLGLVFVGQETTVVAKVQRQELTGNCEAATHYLQTASVGAFSIATGSSGKVTAMGDLFKVASASAKSESARSASSFDGSLEACRKSSPRAPSPPDECGGPIRIEIHPIESAGAAATTAKPDAGKTTTKEAAGPGGGSRRPAPETMACRGGLHFVDGICTRDTPNGYLCARDDLEDCRAQCDKGNGGSCFNLGFITGDDEKVRAYKRGCDLGHANSCAELGYVSNRGSYFNEKEPGDFAKVIGLFDKACAMGSPFGCYYLGSALGDSASPKTHDPVEAFKALDRGCSLGNADACSETARAYLEGNGVAKDTKQGIDYFVKACQSGILKVCEDFARTLRFGRRVPKDPERALKIYTKLCNLQTDDENERDTVCESGAAVAIELGRDEEAATLAKTACPDEKESHASACVPLADLYDAGRGGLKKDPSVAQAIYKRACEARDRDACKKVKAPSTSSGKSSLKTKPKKGR